MARLLHILFVVFYRRTLLSLMVLALAWDFYYVGPKDSVFLYGVLTLSERALEGSRHFPDFMDQAYDAFQSFVDRVNNAAAVFLETYREARPTEFGAVDKDVAWALTAAGYRTGVSPDYLTKVARLESRLNADAADGDDDRAGLYLVDAATWVRLVDEHGASYGLGGYAKEITCDHAANCTVASKSAEQEILELRHEGMTATFLAAELTRQNKETLETRLSRDVEDQELYLAHLMGVDRAEVFITSLDMAPLTSASDLFPQFASDNASLFFGPLGSQRTINTVHTLLAEKWTDCEKAATQYAVTTPVATSANAPS